MTPYLTADGWLRMPYDGPEIAVIEIQLARGDWLPAYLDWDGGSRVAQVRWYQSLPPSGRIRVNGTVTASWGPRDAAEEPASAAAPAAGPPGRPVAGSSRDSSVT